MLDDRFSATAFQQLGLNTAAARERADLLADEVNKQLHLVVEAEMREIMGKLNAMGHNLELKNSAPGEVDYRDESEEGNHEGCRLRLAVDTVVSTGYAHLLTEYNFSENPDE